MMSDELEVAEIVHDMMALPHTGEIVAYQDPWACAIALSEIRKLEYRLKDAKKWLQAAIAEESQRQGSKTIRWEGVTAVVSDTPKVDWDVTELIKLLDLGLPQERYAALVKEEVTYKVSAAEADRIAKGKPEYRQVIERARHESEKLSVVVSLGKPTGKDGS